MRYISLIICAVVFVFSLHAVPTEEIQVEELIKSTEMWNGKQLPKYPDGQPEVTILKITIPPQTSLAWHKHPVINCGVLLSGELTVTADDGKVMQLEAGDPLVELVKQSHYGKNPGDEPAVILVFYAGAEGTPITILDKD